MYVLAIPEWRPGQPGLEVPFQNKEQTKKTYIPKIWEAKAERIFFDFEAKDPI